MLEEVFSYPSADGRTTIHGRRWIPEGKIRGVLQIAHGMCEYIERYEEFAAFLAEKGLLVTGHDHLGHGQSVVSKDDLGFFAEKDGNRAVLEDMHQEYQLTRAWLENSGRGNSETPYILFGHSMGSFLTRQYLFTYGEDLSGAVICGTGYVPYAEARFGMLTALEKSKTHGGHYHSSLLQNLSLGSYNSAFKPARTDFDWLSVNEENVDRYVADPLCGFPFTANGFYNMFLGLTKIVEPANLKKMPSHLPVLFISGDRDPVGNMGRGVEQTAELFRKNGMENVTVRLYPGDRHEILQENNRQEVFGDVFLWIEDQGILS